MKPRRIAARGARLRSAAALSVVLLAVTASGQWLERRVWLPDSFPELGEAHFVFHNPVTNRMYFGGWRTGAVNIYDVGEQAKYNSLPHAGCYDIEHCPDAHTIWITSPDEGTILLVDDRADTIVRTIRDVVGEPIYLEYNPLVGRVYVSDFGGNEELVRSFDAATGELQAEIRVWDDGVRMALDTAHNRIYCAAWWRNSPASVIDCAADTWIGDIPGTHRNTDVLVHPDGKRLYCLGYNPANIIRIVDTDSLTVVDSILIPTSEGWYDFGRLYLNPDRDVLYAAFVEDVWNDGRNWSGHDTLAVVDCSADTLTGMVGLPDGLCVSALAFVPRHDKVYLTAQDGSSVAVLAAPDSITGLIELGGDGVGVGWFPADDRAYVSRADGMVMVVDGLTDSIVDSIDYAFRSPVDDIRWTSAGNKLYVWRDDSLGVLGSGDSIVRWVGAADPFIAYSAELDRMYLGPREGTRGLTVYDCGSDSVLRVVDIEIGNGPVVPGLLKLYMTSGATTLVYDLVRDSVVATGDHWGELIYNPRTGLLYGIGRQLSYVSVVDPRTDSMVARIPNLMASTLAFNTTDNEAYVLKTWLKNLVLVLDAEQHAIVDTIVLDRLTEKLVWQPGTNKLYCLSEDGIEVVNLRLRQAEQWIPLTQPSRNNWLVNDANDRFWVTTRDGLCVIDCLGDSVLARFEQDTGYLALGRTDNRIYSAAGLRISVFRGGAPGVAEEPGQPVAAEKRLPTILRGPELARLDCRVIDALGRDVTDRRDRLAPGVYFLKDEGGRLKDEPGSRAAVQKVIVQR